MLSGTNKKTVLITGGAQRIGAAIASMLARAGWRVLVHANHSAKEASAFCKSLVAGGLDAAPVAPFSFTRSQGVEGCFSAAVEAAHGRLDAVVNNAAIFSRVPLMNADVNDFEDAWRLNALAPIQFTLLLANHLRRQEAQGCVVNLLDQRIAHVSEGDIPYSLSKNTLESFTLSSARELAPTLRVNAVAPGAVLTPAAKGTHESAGKFPLLRKPEADEIASCVRFLLESPFLTGQILFADCGQHLI